MFKSLRIKRVLAPLVAVLLMASTQAVNVGDRQKDLPLTNPLLFSLVPPPPLVNGSFGHQMETFGNHNTDMRSAPRGGDLCLMQVDGTVRFLTAEAGFGIQSGSTQTENAIAVRQPCVHWNGTKALFSMVVGGPLRAFDQTYRSNRWQIYEVTNLDQVVLGATPQIVKIAGQPNYNNVSAIYGSDDKIIFTSDAPLFGMEHTYPQLDEYESATINTGIWKLDPASGSVVHLSHSPSGDFDLSLASDGRIISTRWEHLKRDQQTDAYRYDNQIHYKPRDYVDESVNALTVNAPMVVDGKPFADAEGLPYELFPEARRVEDPTRNPNEPLQDFNEFLPWELSECGEGHQTVNHSGRHEWGGLFQDPSKLDDPNLSYVPGNFSANPYRETVRSDAGIFQIKEDPRPGKEGTFYGTWSREFARFASGRIFEFELPIGKSPQDLAIVDWTNAIIDNLANEKGHFRNPLMLMNGTMLVSYTSQSGLFSLQNPYHFQIAKMEKLTADGSDTEHVASVPFTGDGFQREIVYFGDAAEPLRTVVNMNEVDMVEVVARPRPAALPCHVIDPIEKEVFAEEGVDENELRTWMKSKNLAMIVVRNATERDQGELQQPYNLRVPDGVMTTPRSGKVYDISHLQIFQADMRRGYDKSGRRVLPTPIHNSAQNTDIEETNLFDQQALSGSVKIGLDGSIAAFVPATRALTWQTVSPEGEGIVRERQWITFAPGEVRSCPACHGINNQTMAGNNVPQNKPEALRDLLRAWKVDFNDLILSNGKNLGGEQTLLEQNFPNPFKGVTAIKFIQTKSSMVTLKVYNSQGIEVATLVDEVRSIGTHTVAWNGTDRNGRVLEAGVYYYSLDNGKRMITKKMLLIK
jgi:hypothetical protein